MWWDWGNWWWGMGMMFLMILFWGGVIALIIWGITRLTRGGSTGGTVEKRSPLDVAKDRYARGEITKEQFEQLKKDLS